MSRRLEALRAASREVSSVSSTMEPVLAPASLLAIVVLSVYGATIAPSIAGGDSGELVAEACHLGTAHPPGYPLFTLLIHALTRLPGVPASPAVRANLFCAACGAGAAALVARCVPLLVGARRAADATRWQDHALAAWSGVAAGGLYALSPLTWQYSVTAEARLWPGGGREKRGRHPLRRRGLVRASHRSLL